MDKLNRMDKKSKVDIVLKSKLASSNNKKIRIKFV